MDRKQEQIQTALGNMQYEAEHGVPNAKQLAYGLEATVRAIELVADRLDAICGVLEEKGVVIQREAQG